MESGQTAARPAEDEPARRSSLAMDLAGLTAWAWRLPDLTAVWTLGSSIFGTAGAPACRELLAKMNQQDASELSEAIGAAIRSHGELKTEVRLQQSGQRLRWIALRGRVVEAGGAPELVVTGIDVTFHCQQIEQLRSEVRAEEELMGVVSHELRAPLTAVRLGAAHILRSAARMEGEIKDLLAFAHFKASGSLPIAVEELDLAVLCHEVIEELGAADKTHPIAFDAVGRTIGHWDRLRLAQVLTNLITNAQQYAAPASPILVALHGQADRVVLEVTNAGEPIPPAALRSVFDPFLRVRPAMRGSTNAGLGLFIVAALVRRHGGEVTVRSTREEGTTFTVELPLGPQETS